MKNLKYIKDFLNEKSIIDLTEIEQKEYENISNMISGYLDEQGIYASFDNGYYSHDGDKDLNGLKKYLDKNSPMGINYFFKKYRDVIYEDSNFISKNGFYDYMLYTYDNSYMLNGNGIGPEPEDKLLKYFYGFQTTKLGKIFLDQNYKTIGDFYKACAENFPSYISDFILGDDNIGDYIVKTYDDYSTCIINLYQIYNKNEWNKIENKITNLNSNDAESWAITDDGILIIVFGDISNNINQYDEDIETIKLSQQIKKYNL